MQITLNIGLENCPYNFHQVGSIVTNLPLFDRVEFRQQDGEYNGEPERTLVAQCSLDPKVIRLKNSLIIKRLSHDVEVLCEWLSQESIAFKIESGKLDLGVLVYHREFEGDAQTFNPNYFINF